MQVSIDTLFLGACLNLCAHFEFLAKSYNGDKKKFVERHQKILDLAEDLCSVMRSVVFMQFVISSMLLCVLGFQVVMQEEFMKRMLAASFGVSVIIQLFVYSLGGQLILDKSITIADGFSEYEKDLVIIIARVQKPVKVTAWFYEVSLPTLRAILGTAASLITLLKSFLV